MFQQLIYKKLSFLALWDCNFLCPPVPRGFNAYNISSNYIEFIIIKAPDPKSPDSVDFWVLKIRGMANLYSKFEDFEKKL